MLRKCLIFCALMGIVFGCSKKKPTPPDTPAEVPSPTSNSKPNSASLPSSFILKIRDEQVGDKSFVTELKGDTTVVAFTAAGFTKVKPDTTKTVEKSEYIEEVNAQVPGEIFPTKFTRMYKNAEFKKGNESSKPTSYSGKTVSFEKTFGHYSVLLGKNSLPVDEDQRFRESLERLDKIRYSEMVPTTPIALNEPWHLNSVLVDRMGKVMGYPPSAGKSQATGKLTDAYTKVGKLWGRIDFKYEYVIAGIAPLDEKQGIYVPVTGAIHQDWTVDLVIDGSSNEAITKRKSHGVIEMKGKIETPGKDIDLTGTFTIDQDFAETRAPLK
jgi:hypothetical protein